jgi:hypothetical protein
VMRPMRFPSRSRSSMRLDSLTNQRLPLAPVVMSPSPLFGRGRSNSAMGPAGSEPGDFAGLELREPQSPSRPAAIARGRCLW